MLLKITNKSRFYSVTPLVMALLLVSGCSVNKSQKEKPILFSIKTTSCLGPCAVYEFKMFEGGAYSFKGENNVLVTGEKSGELGEAQSQRILNAINASDFFNVEVEIDRLIKDLPTKYLYANVSGQEREITYYHPRNEKIDLVMEALRAVLRELELIE